MNRRPDGTFTIEFRNADNGKTAFTQAEEGTWSYADGKFTTVTTQIEGKPTDRSDPHFTDSYLLLSLSDKVMQLYHPGHKRTFTSKKVSCMRGAP